MPGRVDDGREYFEAHERSAASARLKRLNADPKFRARKKQEHADPEFIAACRARMQRLNADPKISACRKAALKRLWADPNFIAVCRARGKRLNARRARRRKRKLKDGSRTDKKMLAEVTEFIKQRTVELEKE